MFQHVLAVEQHIFKLAIDVAFGLVGKVLRSGVERDAAGDNALRLNARTKFDRRNKTVAAVAIPFLCIYCSALKRWQLPKLRANHPNGYAG